MLNCTCDDEYNSVVLIKHNNDLVYSAKKILTFKNDEEALNYCTLLDLSESTTDISCRDNLVTINDYVNYMNLSDNLDDLLEKLTIEGYVCK